MSADNRRLFPENFVVNGNQALSFDSGLDARSFAQSRFAQFLNEPGYTLSPSGGIGTWKAAGVIEAGNSAIPGGAATMHVWGPYFEGTRLDLMINRADRRDEALCAVADWIDARLALSVHEPAHHAPLWPCAVLLANTEHNSAATVGQENGQKIKGRKRELFFAPENLARRCIQAEGEDARLYCAEQYVHPDLKGAQAEAFTAAAMLYRVFSGTGAFPASKGEALRQDMREGNFLAIQLAAPGLKPDIAGLIQSALMPAEKSKGTKQTSPAVLQDSMLRRLRKSLGMAIPNIKTCFLELSQTELGRLSEKKEKTVLKSRIRVNTRRFIIRNIALIAGAAIALLICILSGMSIAKNLREAPSTIGMDAAAVVSAYYKALGALDHVFMEACTAGAAGKTDINMAANLFVITRVRQAYEHGQYQFLSPDEWLEAGSPGTDIPVYGITDLHITWTDGDEDSGTTSCNAAYTLWLPMTSEEDKGPQTHINNDELRLEKIKGNWKIVEIIRNGNS